MPYRPYIPQDIGELLDKIASIVLTSPKLKDSTGYFPQMSLDTEFLH